MTERCDDRACEARCTDLLDSGDDDPCSCEFYDGGQGTSEPHVSGGHPDCAYTKAFAELERIEQTKGLPLTPVEATLDRHLGESIATPPPYYVIKWGDEYIERAIEHGRLALTSKQRKAKRFTEEPDGWQWLGRWNPDCIPLDQVRTVRIVRKM